MLGSFCPTKTWEVFLIFRIASLIYTDFYGYSPFFSDSHQSYVHIYVQCLSILLVCCMQNIIICDLIFFYKCLAKWFLMKTWRLLLYFVINRVPTCSRETLSISFQRLPFWMQWKIILIWYIILNFNNIALPLYGKR